ncbi:hypothetical protein DFJ63DRAFT_333865 [Scheffersomyces coipomensis]|uniref:uncharacterized protein n=1 Tax=Scheffersomyces coipomensis TaxID=1788519 RepID=UPI00315DA3AF
MIEDVHNSMKENHYAPPNPSSRQFNRSSPMPTRVKRERPPSSYFEIPPSLESPTSSKSINNLTTTTTTTKSNKDNASPLFNRQPFKNLSNIVLPTMRKKISTSLTQSMSAVSKSSHMFFQSTSTPARGLGIDLTDEDEADVDIDDDGEDTTEEDIEVPGSPTQISKEARSIRRIHSLCQTTKEIESFVPMDDNSYLKNTNIRTFTVENDLLPRIDEVELHKILKGEHKNAFDKCIVVDCRFDYEFEGGHINGAINISTKEQIEMEFIHNVKPDTNLKTLYVFHCEFSVFRGPTIATHLRKCDRRLNRDVYPYLSYPDIVILEGGYKNFFKSYRDLCFPQAYVEMKDVNHEKNCENHMNKARLDNKLTRAKSFNQYDNFFNPHHNNASTSSLPFPTAAHNRSQSYSTNTSEKILKRQRSNSKVLKTLSSASMSSIRLTRASTFSYDQSIFNSNSSSPTLMPLNTNNVNNASNQDIDSSPFLPPSTSFHKSMNDDRKYSSTTSIYSSSSSINSDNNGLFSSCESLTDSSPMIEFPEFFDAKVPIRSGNHNILKPLTKKPSGPVPSLPNRSTSVCGTNNQSTAMTSNSSYKFPITKPPIRLHHNRSSSANSNTLTPTISNNTIIANAPGSAVTGNVPSTITTTVTNKFTNNPFLMSSPIISSPLSTTTPISIFDSTISTHGPTSSIIDPINETPVDFTVPISGKIGSINSRYINHSRRTSGSFLSSAGGGLYNFIDIDEVDEVDEEEEEDEVDDDEEDDTFYNSTNNTKDTTPGNSIITTSTFEKAKMSALIQKNPFNTIN